MIEFPAFLLEKLPVLRPVITSDASRMYQDDAMLQSQQLAEKMKNNKLKFDNRGNEVDNE